MKKIILVFSTILLIVAMTIFTIKIIDDKSEKNAKINAPEEATTQVSTTETTETMVVTEEATEATPTDSIKQPKTNRIDSDSEDFPRSHNLDLDIIIQFPELPAGCESVSLTMLLNYYGFELDKTYICDNYLVYSDNFVLGYTGDPTSSSIGGGCYAPGMTETANNFLKAKDSSYRAKNITGTSFDDLLEYIAGDTPVMVWTTINMGESSKGYIEYDNLGNAYAWDNMEHCVVLAGYDLDKNIVTVYDPMKGVMERDLEAFKYTYESMYSMSIIMNEYK